MAIQPTITITFDPPLSFNGKSYPDVTLREPTGDEYDQAAKNPGFGLERQLLITIGKMLPVAAALVPVSRLVRVRAFVAQFFQLPPEEDEVPAEPEPPQEGDAEIFAKMELREPTCGEMEAAGSGSRGTAKLVSLVTGIPFRTALRMPASVSYRADLYFAGFSMPSPATGES